MTSRLQRNIEHIRERIEGARTRGAHAAADVRLVVVTKAAPPTIFASLADLGVRDVAENRVAAAVERRPHAPPGLTWHGIGHLQRNKAARAVDLFDVFHALDSDRLAEKLESVLVSRGRRWPVYIEVNAALDPAKCGIPPEEALAFVKDVAHQSHLEVRGFMTMAAYGADEATARSTFRTLREIRDEAVRAGVGTEPPAELSMGMTDDFEWAVEEGATVVRVGRAIFEGLEDPA